MRPQKNLKLGLAMLINILDRNSEQVFTQHTYNMPWAKQRRLVCDRGSDRSLYHFKTMPFWKQKAFKYMYSFDLRLLADKTPSWTKPTKFSLATGKFIAKNQFHKINIS